MNRIKLNSFSWISMAVGMLCRSLICLLVDCHLCRAQKLQVCQVRLTSTRDELIKEQGSLRRQLDRVRRHRRRSVSASLSESSSVSSSSTSSSSSLLLDQGPHPLSVVSWFTHDRKTSVSFIHTKIARDYLFWHSLKVKENEFCFVRFTSWRDYPLHACHF